MSSPRTLSASSTPPPSDRDSHPRSAAGICDSKNVEGERSNTEDGQQSCRINLKADDDDASSCLSSEVRLGCKPRALRLFGCSLSLL